MWRATRPTATWDELLREHAAALDAFSRAASEIPAAMWDAPRDAGVWSPAKLTQHLTLVYPTLEADLATGKGFALKFRWWQRALIRWRYLPQIMRDGRLPRAHAPREIRPTGEVMEQTDALAQLRTAGTRFAEHVSAQPAQRFTHPYMGRLNAAQILRYCAVHLADHMSQLPMTGAAPV